MDLSRIHPSWQPVMGHLYNEPLKTFLNETLTEKPFAPKLKDIFKVFEVDVKSIKVVMIGDEPESKYNTSNGLAFGRYKQQYFGTPLNILRTEIVKTVPWSLEKTEDYVGLEHWQKQGVFLLNSSLTSVPGEKQAHSKIWEAFTNSVVRFIARESPCIWMLWGDARVYKYFIVNNFHVSDYDLETITEIPANRDWNYILTGAGIMDLKEGRSLFLGCNHFSYCNTILQKTKSTQIKW